MAKQKQNSPENLEEKAQNINAFENALFRWKTPRYLRYERGWMWFVFMFASCAGLAFYGYRTESLTMMGVFALLPLVLLLEHRKKPEWVEVVISEYGIRFGEMTLPFSGMSRFWILHNPPYLNELHVETESKMHKEYVIQMLNIDPTQIRQYLATQVPEWEGKHLSLLDTLTRILKLN
ncbi:hypothetical protein IPG41_06135 [Candidatus Peregrinibacteria bacterium]|nr:MAG: hypothetical protein IPG41_06135 [Candidatus Peregrinibacteria bacterium]